MSLKILKIVVIIFLFSACRANKEIKNQRDKIMEDYSIVINPNALEKPGTLFFIDDNGKEQMLEILDLELLSGEMSVVEVEGSQSLSLGLLFKLFEIPIDAGFGSDSKVTYDANYSNANVEKIELLKVQNLLKEKKIEISNSIFFDKNKKRRKFYLITESVKASSAKFNFTVDKNFSAGVNVEIEKIAAVNAKLKREKFKSYSISDSFDQKLYVLRKLYELDIRSAGLSGTVQFKLKNEFQF